MARFLRGHRASEKPNDARAREKGAHVEAKQGHEERQAVPHAASPHTTPARGARRLVLSDSNPFEWGRASLSVIAPECAGQNLPT